MQKRKISVNCCCREEDKTVHNEKMSLGKIGRKLKRVGKGAVQFRFTSTLEYIDLQLKGTWRPDKLRVIWLRNHRRVESINLQWVPTEDRGPNGADGRATFDPPLSISLIVTLYRDATNEARFEEKEYKYYIENVGPSGKKILASFNCDMAEYAGIPSERHTLDMTFKTVSKKVEKALLGITLESEFMKQGTSNDEDMQSTFSAMSAGGESLQFDEDDEDDTNITIAASEGKPHQLSVVEEKDEEADVEKQRAENSLKQTERRTSASNAKPRRSVESIETYRPPPNPYMAEQEMNGDAEEEEYVPPSPTASWIGEEAMFVNCFGETVDREKLDRAKIIGLYFSASWCPPCRTFLPRLIKFYHHLKQHGKSFEILHISSDYSKQDMMKYMLDQQMPWVGLSYDCKAGETLKKRLKVSAIPLLTIVSTKGSKLEDSAKKQVQASSSGATILKLYNQWYDKLDPEEKEDIVDERSVSEVVESKERKGLLKKVKSHFTGKEKNKEMGDNEADSPGLHRSQSKEDGLNDSVRQTVEEKPRTKRSKSHVTTEMMEEKEETIRHLEEVNRTLKQTNDDLNEDVAEMRRQLQDALTKLADLESTSQQLQDEKRELMANLNIRGWLFKRGIKGPTASVWRRRYFRCDQGSKIYYYKSASEGRPQGFIDLDKIISVQEVSSAQQDKNHATFLVQCDGRTYQLQAMDEANMRKWIGAINYLKEYRRRNSQALLDQAAAN